LVTVEYELRDASREIRGFTVSLPVPGGAAPVVSQVDGQFAHDSKAERLVWTVASMDKDNASGTLEYKLPSVVEASQLLPMEVMFAMTSTYSNMSIQSVTIPGKNDPLKFSQQRQLLVEKFIVES